MRLCGLGVVHQPEPVVERLKVHDPVVPDPELLLRSLEVDVLGGEPEESGVLLDGFLPLHAPAAEGAVPVVDSSRHPDVVVLRLNKLDVRRYRLDWTRRFAEDWKSLDAGDRLAFAQFSTRIGVEFAGATPMVVQQLRASEGM